MSVLGWSDSTEFLNAKQEFDDADKKYHVFLPEVKRNKFSPTDINHSKRVADLLSILVPGGIVVALLYI